MKAHQRTVGQKDEWITPQWILNSLGEFDLDPCSPIDRPWDTANNHFTIEDDGLSMPWFGRVWCNPPFNRYEKGKWMAKMAEHNNGILLVPASCEIKEFQKYVWGKCSGILFLNRRPHFHHIDGSRAIGNSGCTICLVAYGSDNLNSLINSSLGNVVSEVSKN